MAINKTTYDGDTVAVCQRLEAFEDRPEVNVMVRALCVGCGEIVAVPPEVDDDMPCLCGDCYSPPQNNSEDAESSDNGNSGEQVDGDHNNGNNR